MDFAQIIKERVTSREMLERFGVGVDSRGMACCPFHGEKTPSLKVYRENRRGWYCYGCHAGGDVIDLAKRFYGVRFKEAMERINEEFGLGLPMRSKLSPDERKRISAEIDQKRAERAARKAALDALEKAYWSAYDAWLKNESIIAEQAPQGPLGEPSDAFIEAITRQAEIRHALDTAEEEWMSARAG